MSIAQGATWAICVATIIGVVGLPWRLPEWRWAVGGASLLIVCGLLPIGMAGSAVAKGGASTSS